MSRVSFGPTSTTRSGQPYGLGSTQVHNTFGNSQYNRTTDYVQYPREPYGHGHGQGWGVYGNTMANKYKGQFGWGKTHRNRKMKRSSKRKNRTLRRRATRSVGAARK